MDGSRWLAGCAGRNRCLKELAQWFLFFLHEIITWITACWKHGKFLRREWWTFWTRKAAKARCEAGFLNSPPVELGTCPRCWSRTVAWSFAEPSTKETRAEAIEGMWWIWGLTARDHKRPLLNRNILPNVILFQFSYCRWFSLISMISSSLQWHDLLGVGLW